MVYFVLVSIVSTYLFVYKRKVKIVKVSIEDFACLFDYVVLACLEC